jgi:hypothetical protein
MGRGRAQASHDLIEAAADIVAECAPITVRGIAYKLFAQGLIDSMATNETKRVSRLVVLAREEGLIDWDDVVDDSRPIKRPHVYDTPRTFANAARNSWRADPWTSQPYRVELISEKATVAGVLSPVLEELAIPFRPFKGFTSATSAHTLAVDTQGDDPLILLYVGDHDPSGCYMSQVDLPGRVERYGGEPALRRIALTQEDVKELTATGATFSVETKSDDTRFAWFVSQYGRQARCAELDALDPNILRARVRSRVDALIKDREAWDRVEVANTAVKNSLDAVLAGWAKKASAAFSDLSKDSRA